MMAFYDYARINYRLSPTHSLCALFARRPVPMAIVGSDPVRNDRSRGPVFRA
jgi:hypothetical protein